MQTPKYLSCLRNYRVKNQILIIQLLILTVIIALLTIVLVINRVIIESYIENVSFQLLQNINQKALSKQSSYLKYQTELTFNFGFNLLNKLNIANLFLLPKLNKKLDTLPFSCINLNSNQTQIMEYYLPQFCYYYANNENYVEIPDDEQDQNIIFLVGILNQQLLILRYFDLDPTIYFTLVGNGQFFTITPQKMRYPEYRPIQRQWYLDHIAALNTSEYPQVVSEIYRNYETQEYEFTLTVSLLDQNNEFEGIFALDSNFQVIKPKINYDQLNIYLVDSDGRILLANVYPDINFVSETKFFNDTTLTGFNNDDWIQIFQYITTSIGQSNCNFNSQVFCRHNTFQNQDIFIKGFGIYNRFYQIVFIDYKFMQQNEIDTENLKNSLLNWASKQLIYYVIYNFAGIFICWIILHFSLQPYNQLTKVFQQTAQSRFNQKYEIALKQVKIFQHNNLIQTGLTNLCHKLSEIRSRKSKECHFMENFKYPRNFAKNAYKLRSNIKQFPKKSSLIYIEKFKQSAFTYVLQAFNSINFELRSL